MRKRKKGMNTSIQISGMVAENRLPMREKRLISIEAGHTYGLPRKSRFQAIPLQMEITTREQRAVKNTNGWVCGTAVDMAMDCIHSNFESLVGSPISVTSAMEIPPLRDAQSWGAQIIMMPCQYFVLIYELEVNADGEYVISVMDSRQVTQQINVQLIMFIHCCHYSMICLQEARELKEEKQSRHRKWSSLRSGGCLVRQFRPEHDPFAVHTVLAAIRSRKLWGPQRCKFAPLLSNSDEKIEH